MLDWFEGDRVDHPFAEAKRTKEVIDAFHADDPLAGNRGCESLGRIRQLDRKLPPLRGMLTVP